MSLAAFVAAALTVAQPVPPVPDAADWLRRTITEGGRHCAEGRPDQVVAHYAKDILLTYPGAQDQNYEILANAYRRLCNQQEGSVESTVPTFEEVIVSGDIAIVRVIWTTRLRGMAAGESRQLRDLQLWRRAGGSWEFFRGVHYPHRPAAPAPQGEQG